MLVDASHPHPSEQEQALLEQALQHNELVSQFDPALYGELRAALTLMWVKSGEAVMSAGEPSDSLALVVLGRVRIVQHTADGGEKRLLELGHGQTIGEMGMIMGDVRSADVVAVRDTLLALLTRDDYDKLVQAHPKAMNQQFVRPIIRRLQAQLSGTKRINAAVLNIVLLPATPSLPLRPIAKKLLTSMQKIGPILYLDSGLIREQFGEIDDDTAEQEKALTRWLGEQEANHEVVVYVADPQSAEWTRRCLRQADKIVIVGEGDAESPATADRVPGLTWAEAEGKDRYLVLVQPDDCERPQGTRLWLETLDIRHHYHLRLGVAADGDRVGRLLAERGIGVVLGGASARGFAHIGVLNAFHEAGVPVDVIGGVSSGAVSAIGIATQWETEAIIHRAGSGPKIQYTIPFSAFTTGYGNVAWMHNMFGDLQIEGCWLPNFVATYNLTRNVLLTHEHGPAVELLRTATALPGIFPPYVDKTEVFVDAGVLNFLPVDLMRARPDIATVISIDVITEAKKNKRSYTYDGLISGWSILWNRLNPFAKPLRYVKIRDIYMSAILSGAVRSRRETRDMADITIRLLMSDFDMMDFSDIRGLIEFGRKSAAAAIQEQGIAEALAN